MSEMLGNQYFLVRNFEKALQQFEKVAEEGHLNEKIRKKMIICYCEVGNVDAALALFEKVITENIDLIVLTDIVSEDCPCPELLERMKWYEKIAANSFDFNCIIGMLNLYCNIDESIKYFLRSRSLQPADLRVNRILKLIKAYQKSSATH
jgi:pentatricopeptide repeat protein